MANKPSSQKFIGRNRPPRVQIEFDVDSGNGIQKVEIPFVMGVMADLSGKSASELPDVSQRKFLEIDGDNFEKRLEAMKPRVTFSVPNKISADGGSLGVDITFQSMEDFSPGAIAQKVEPLRRLLEARTNLNALMARMDGKAAAEKLLSEGIQSKALLEGLVGSGNKDNS